MEMSEMWLHFLQPRRNSKYHLSKLQNEDKERA